MAILTFVVVAVLIAALWMVVVNQLDWIPGTCTNDDGSSYACESTSGASNLLMVLAGVISAALVLGGIAVVARRRR